MEIKTKYNIGDKIWVIADNKPVEFVISDIEICIYKYSPLDIWYSNDDDDQYTEEQVFPTKEELLKSL